LLLLKTMIKLALILMDIRSTHNVGSIMRSADCFGVSHIYFAGYTPYPKLLTDKRLPYLADKISRSIHKTALGAETNLPFSVYNKSANALIAARRAGYTLAALEQSPNSQPLQDYHAPAKLALILGNEVTGVSRQTLKTCDVILEITMLGKKESLNVSTSAAIALYAMRFGGSQS